MRKLSVGKSREAMTVVEVLVVLATIAILVIMILPAASNHHHAPPVQTKCLFQLRQVSIATWMYVDENHGKFPMQVSVTHGGTMEFLNGNQTFPHFEKFSGYIRDPRILLCPAEKERHSAESYVRMNDTNISYFLNADVSLTNYPTASILAGDRNLQANGQTVHPGLFTLTPDLDMNWTGELHRNGGNLAFADGHAEYCKMTNLNLVIQRQSIPTNRLSVP